MQLTSIDKSPNALLVYKYQLSVTDDIAASLDFYLTRHHQSH